MHYLGQSRLDLLVLRGHSRDLACKQKRLAYKIQKDAV
jgi:hypothetical protein